MKPLVEDVWLRDVLKVAYPPEVLERWPDYGTFTPWLDLRKPVHLIRSGDQLSSNITAFPGVYVVAIFDGEGDAPVEAADPFHEKVVYIGRTRTDVLGSRWASFRSAARTGRGPHSGGNSFHRREIAEAGRALDEVLAATRIAGLPVWFGTDPTSRQPETSFRTALLESVLIEAVHRHRVELGWAELLNKA